MAKADWNITGSGGMSVVSDAGSNRLQLQAVKLVLYNGNSSLLNAEIIADIKMYSASANQGAGFVLRSNPTGDDCYFLRINGNGYVRTYSIYRMVSGTSILLTTINSTQLPGIYVRTRFRIDGDQISVEEYLSGEWVLITLVSDTVITSPGYAGLRSNGVSGYWIQYDNIEIGEKV